MLFLLAIVCCLGSVSGYFSRFDRMVLLDNNAISDSSTFTQASLTLDQCARECHDNSSCNIFSHNADGGICQQMSKAKLNINSEEDAENKVFWKNAVCPSLEVVKHGQVRYFSGLEQGDCADFVCDDHYAPSITSALCDVSGTWLGLDTACKPIAMPLTIPVEEKDVTNLCFAFTAIVTVGTSFTLRYTEPSGDIHLMVSLRFNDRGDVNTIVRNNLLNNNWGTEETDTPVWPFQLNRQFNMSICAHDTQYKGTCDGVEIFTFAFRSPLSVIKTIQIEDSVSVRSVRFTFACPTSCNLLANPPTDACE